MSEIQNNTNDESAPSDLINFLKAIPDGRFRRVVRYPQWFLLLVAVLGILVAAAAPAIWSVLLVGTEKPSTRR
jgi:type VI protein secretion system component VasF